MKRISPKFILLSILIGILSFASVLAWTNPTSNPTSGNAAIKSDSAPANSIYINSSGNIGVGTTNPERKLYVYGGNILLDNTKTLEAKNSAGTVETWMWPRYSDDVMYTNFGSGGWNIRNSSSTNVMFMESGGNVGIGTTNPGTNKLEVVGGPIKATGGLIIETRTSDPTSPATGQMWLRTDL